MRLRQNWHRALDCARLGDLSPAGAARAAESGTALADYFYARCLAESPPVEEGQFARAVELLRPAVASQPSNPVFIQALILALARDPTEASRREAARLWRRHGLSHDLELLGQSALTVEMQLRPFPERSETRELPWPAQLARPTALGVGGDKMSHPVASEVPEIAPEPEGAAVAVAEEPHLDPLPGGKTPSGRTIRKLENALLAHHGRPVVEEATALLDQGFGGIELHLLAGLAAEEEGDPERARAHMARAARIDPTLLMVRSEQARIYWRLGRVELAIALWRSLPVEGPFDYGRHYHLALGHEALGDRRGALAAMGIALNEFYYDVRHFYVKRVWERWVAAHVDAPAGA